ncbi:MAG: hypothetical protein BWX80_00707 [Candidatus Hydrogenedentes bacterium ADurb.Bin101]|nr:MAG: hypothetical protein BWX80_00707 [Candidatus Hydrogenedentes bacterium ADurb.Bin101]
MHYFRLSASRKVHFPTFRSVAVYKRLTTPAGNFSLFWVSSQGLRTDQACGWVKGTGKVCP